MDIENGRLAAQGRHHTRVAMADVRHIVIGIQVALAAGVIQPYAVAVHQMQWLVVKQR